MRQFLKQNTFFYNLLQNNLHCPRMRKSHPYGHNTHKSTIPQHKFTFHHKHYIIPNFTSRGNLNYHSYNPPTIAQDTTTHMCQSNHYDAIFWMLSVNFLPSALLHFYRISFGTMMEPYRTNSCSLNQSQAIVARIRNSLGLFHGSYCY